jgi:hypothetical protein
MQGKDNQIVLDQIRSIDKQRIIKKIGKLTSMDSAFVSRLRLKQKPSAKWRGTCNM